MAKTPLIAAAIGTSTTPPSEDKKRAVKPRPNKTTKGEKSVTEPGQQHGELANDKQPKAPTDRAMEKSSAKSAKRCATDSWVSGHMTTEEHSAIHKRADHVLTGKPVREFKGKSGERKMKW